MLCQWALPPKIHCHTKIPVPIIVQHMKATEAYEKGTLQKFINPAGEALTKVFGV